MAMAMTAMPALNPVVEVTGVGVRGGSAAVVDVAAAAAEAEADEVTTLLVALPASQSPKPS